MATVQENRRKRCARNKEYVQSKYTPCVKCGFFHVDAMDWHHIDESTKKRGVSELSRTGQSIQTIQEEIDKCICVCSNCHRIMHGSLAQR